MTEGDYITYATFQDIMLTEKNPFYKLAFETIWELKLRVTEGISIKDEDIDAVEPSDVGLESDHTVKIWRKRHKFQILPVSSYLYKKWVKHIKEHKMKGFLFSLNGGRRHIHRSTAYKNLVKHGMTIGGEKPIHPHALRRGGGIKFRQDGGTIEDLQALYNHSNMWQTVQYIGITKTEALNRANKILERRGKR